MVVLESGVGNYVLFNNKKYSYFAGNNYLGLANHPQVKEAAIRSIEQYGVNSSASRQTTGTCGIHLELERDISLFKQTEDSAVFASGYMGNTMLLQVLRSEYGAVFIDESAHPSILASVPRDVAQVNYYQHADTSHLEALLDKNRNFRPLVITDGLFALTGEIAPLDRIYSLVGKYNGLLVADDAHSTGVLGENGRGTPEYFHLEDKENLFQTETMSKALGANGGFISGRANLIDLIRKKSAVYQASTALAPPVVAAGIASIRILRENPGLRVRLLGTAKKIKTGIAELGFSTTADITPIVPVMFQSLEKAKGLSQYLEDNNIIVPCIEYPVKLKYFMIRITASADHTMEQTEALLHLLKKWRDKNGTD